MTLTQCLGPGDDHSFLSPDPKRIKFCRKCKEWKTYQEKTGVSTESSYGRVAPRRNRRLGLDHHGEGRY